MAKIDLKTLVDNYGKLDATEKEYKKQVETIKTKIKAVLLENNETEASGDNYNVKCTAISSSKLNEDKLLNKLKEMGYTECIKTKEYVDIDMLESAVYAGKVDAKILSDCKETSVTYRLNCFKNKE